MFVVLEDPALLAGMPYPEPDFDWTGLYARGFRHLVRLHPGDYDAAPLAVQEILLEDLYGGRAPTDAAAEREAVFRAARFAADAVARGEGVVVHCVGGT